jgi:hypothetical protein
MPKAWEMGFLIMQSLSLGISGIPLVYGDDIFLE